MGSEADWMSRELVASNSPTVCPSSTPHPLTQIRDHEKPIQLEPFVDVRQPNQSQADSSVELIMTEIIDNVLR